ncbi:hypothetical protein [Peribacillus frigoritolerans]|uniref:hypothetical protein n=1 Tax=Peribacillus frigoritolerans TaxID=450367 RepID=UPI002E1C2153|nr:hypothetical protein [Peribacillus frigoritolerans]
MRMGEIATDRADSDSHLKKMFYKLLGKSNSKVFDGWEEYQKEIPISPDAMKAYHYQELHRENPTRE